LTKSRNGEVEPLKNFGGPVESPNKNETVQLRRQHGVWYLRVPKALRKLHRIPEILNWEVEVRQHPSGNPLLAEIVHRPVAEAKSDA